MSNRLLNEDDIIKVIDEHTTSDNTNSLDNDISIILEDVPEANLDDFVVSKAQLQLAIDEINQLPRSTVTAPTAIIGVNKTHYLIEYPLVMEILNRIIGVKSSNEEQY